MGIYSQLNSHLIGHIKHMGHIMGFYSVLMASVDLAMILKLIRINIYKSTKSLPEIIFFFSNQCVNKGFILDVLQ